MTARSVPRYFREGLKNNRPKQPNRNILNAPFNGGRSQHSHDDYVLGHNDNLSFNATGRYNGNQKQYMNDLPETPQESTTAEGYHTPMESTYYNFTNQQSLPGFVNDPSYAKESFHATNNFTKHYYNNEPKSLSHLPTKYTTPTSTVIRAPPHNDHVTVTCNSHDDLSNALINTNNIDYDTSSNICNFSNSTGQQCLNNTVQQGDTGQQYGISSTSRCSNKSSLRRTLSSSNARDTSPDHLGIPGSRATLVPGYHHHHHHHHHHSAPPGDTSDESTTSTVSPPRYTRRAGRSNSTVGHVTSVTARCK